MKSQPLKVGDPSERHDLDPAALIIDVSEAKDCLSRTNAGRAKYRPNSLEQALGIGPVEIDLRGPLSELVTVDLAITGCFKGFFKPMCQRVDRPSLRLGAEPVARESELQEHSVFTRQQRLLDRTTNPHRVEAVGAHGCPSPAPPRSIAETRQA
ncbi:hypothetical protein ACIBI3_03765 [Actinomadura luteofluorescens]|uniref:hypothetical protein n=1 Tax=Actinomadura luteofluorescens TaxID=46163 RepID=UPI003473E4E3